MTDKKEDKKARLSRCLSNMHELDDDDSRWLSAELGERGVVVLDDKGRASPERTAKALELAKVTGLLCVEGGKTLAEALAVRPAEKIPACSVTGQPLFEGKVHGVEWEKLPVERQEVAGLAVLRGLLGSAPDDAKHAFWALQQSPLPPPFHDLAAEWAALDKKEGKTEGEEELAGRVRRRRFWKAAPPPPPPPPPSVWAPPLVYVHGDAIGSVVVARSSQEKAAAAAAERRLDDKRPPLVYVYAPPGENYKVAGQLTKRLRPYEQNGLLRAVSDETDFRVSASQRAQLMREAALVVYVMSADCLEGSTMTEIQTWMRSFDTDHVMVAAGQVVGADLYPAISERMPMLPRGMRSLRSCAASDDWWAALVKEIAAWVESRGRRRSRLP